ALRRGDLSREIAKVRIRISGFPTRMLQGTEGMVRRSALVFVVVVACHGAAAVDSGVVVVDATAGDAATQVEDAKEELAVDAMRAPEGMTWVPPGTFTMGAEHGGEEDERPAHKVTLAGFFLDQTPVTNEAYAACVKASACAGLGWRDAKYMAPLHPVNTATW